MPSYGLHGHVHTCVHIHTETNNTHFKKVMNICKFTQKVKRMVYTCFNKCLKVLSVQLDVDFKVSE